MSNRTSPNPRTLGVTFSTRNNTNVVLWAPSIEHAAIKIYGKPAVLPLNREELGYWRLSTDQIQPGDLYQFVINGQDERSDPISLSQPQGVHGPSEAVDTTLFQWEDQHWQSPQLADYLIYELHISTFTPGGTFSALEEKLDYLIELGINAIELMPISQFPDGRNWGYDGVFPFAAENAYGGPTALQHMVNACHQKGIAVVLDVVYNHLGPEGNYMNEFGPFLTDKYSTPWGNAINVDDVWSDGVRQFILENALMWLRDFHIDALRLDAVHAIKDFSPVHILAELREQVDQLKEATGRRHYLIVENDLNDPRFINPLAEHGYGMDAQWMDEFHHALRVSAGEKQEGYYADFDGIGHLAKAYRDAYVYDGQFSAVRKKLFGRKAPTSPGHQFIVFSQNHDQVGNRKLGERSSQLYSFELQKLLAGAVLISPYVPLLFMGEEWGETAPFLYFVSHTEPELAEAVRQGRQEEFADFHDGADVPDPLSDDTFQRSQLQWSLLEQEPHQTLFRYYQVLIALRRQHPVLRHLNRQNLNVVENEEKQTLVVHRWHEDQQLLCLLNFANQPQSLSVSEGSKGWQKFSTRPSPSGWDRVPLLTSLPILVRWLSPPNRCLFIPLLMTNPIATYRIQFHKEFTFSHFEQIIPYLDKLGIKTVYASPIFEAVAGSQHGYDVVNPQLINPEIGTQAQLTRIHQQLAERGIGWLQDIVPNHMAFDPANTWLMDVLEKGQRSIYSCFFDIDWTSPVHHGRLMVPFLGNSLEAVLQKGELAVAWQDNRLVLAYYDSAYPLRLNSYVRVLQATDNKSGKAIQLLLSQLPDLDQLTDATTYSLRSREWQLKLAQWLNDTDHQAYFRDCLEVVNTDTNRLQQLVDEQVYRLCVHGETDYRINYRRFFTVNSLICLNSQDLVVFDHVHEHTKNMLKAGVLQGLRVDHIDGLHDPSRYLEQLREMAGDEAYIVVEKILESGEELPVSWPIQGATGYQFLALVNNLFTRTGSQQKFTQFYTKLLGEKQVVHQEVQAKKAYILDEHMRGELDNLFVLFQSLNLVDEDRLAALPADTLKAAIGEFLVQCPVYRYYGNYLPLKIEEAMAIQAILERVRRFKPNLKPAADLLEDVLLIKPQAGDDDYNERALRFYQRCMQFTGPLMAKGVEDTLMYTYNRFIGHDEVGDSPDFFGLTTDDFHQKMLDRQAQWPLALNATSTHDTKRGEDVRSRLNVLTDLADEWFAEVEAWQELNRDLKQADSPGVDSPSVDSPDANDEYFIYQTLLGVYPMPTIESANEPKRSTSSPGQDEKDVAERLDEYLQKALREAKRNSTYTEPNEVYEEATKAFARQLLDPTKPFWKRFEPFCRRITDLGIINSLAQVVLKCTCPGLPDIYQGCEGWDLSLVDPDNRRPVDFDQRQRWLDELTTRENDDQWAELWQHRYDARIKLWLIHTLLNERNQHVDLFANGQYIPLQVEGRYKEHVMAFARHYERSWYVVAIPLGVAQLCREQDTDAVSLDWGNTRIILPAEAPRQWTHRLTNATGKAANGIAIADLFTFLPLAVIQLEQPSSDRSAGILLSITSLPSPFGVGDFGAEARTFADFLSRSHQTYWQVLPLNPVDAVAGFSPYSTSSSMAGSPLLLSPSLLKQAGLLTDADLQAAQLTLTNRIDYQAAR
ncbi:hypothetical protein GCM10028825_30640 [Spirosoma agri]